MLKLEQGYIYLAGSMYSKYIKNKNFHMCYVLIKHGVSHTVLEFNLAFRLGKKVQ